MASQVLPAEIIHAQYASGVLDFLSRSFQRIHLVVFEERVFPGALEEVVLLFADDRADGQSAPVRLVSCSNLKELSPSANQREEAAGDLTNIRRRYPMSAFGYAYLVTRNVVEDEPAAWERIKDMLRKLTTLSTNDERASYDATCLIVAHWPGDEVILDEECVPDDLSPDVFLERMLRTLFSRSPVSEHIEARKLFWTNSSPAEIDF